MNELNLRSASTMTPAIAPTTIKGAAPRGHIKDRIKEERLPFTIRLVQSESDLYKAIRIRHAAYARHLPELGEKLKEPEAMDFDSDVAVLLAESKLDGTPLGTARIQTNVYRPLCVEQSITLPAYMDGLRLSEVTRLGVENGRIGRLVKVALFKACFQYWERHDIDWVIAAGREPIDQQYTQLLFEDLYPEQGFIPLRHAGNIPHRVMAFEMATSRARWAAAKHPLLGFVCHTNHPDISVERRTAAMEAMPRHVRTPEGVTALAQ